MEELMQYIRPELLAVAVVLYLVGMGMKKADVVKDKWIPIVLGGGCDHLWNLYLCHLHLRRYPGNCHGCFYGDYPGNSDGGAQYLC